MTNNPPSVDFNDKDVNLQDVETSIIILDKELKIVYANPSFCDLIGYRLEEIFGRNISLLRCPDNPQSIYDELRASIFAGKEWKGRILDRKKNGDIIDLLTTVTPIKNTAGQVTHFIGAKENLAAKNKHDKYLEEMERLSQLGRISGSLLHELKSHYALIKMNMDQVEPRSKAEENNFIIIKRDLEKLNRYFQNILQYLRKKEYNMTNVNLHDVINNSYSFIFPLITEKTIQFDNHVAGEIIKADYQQLQCVFKNMMQNSADAIEREGRIETWSEKANGSVKVYFKDDGAGMSCPERAFEPFYSTKASGSGLGLAISEGIIQKHNGSLKLLKSEKGETIFEIIFQGVLA